MSADGTGLANASRDAGQDLGPVWSLTGDYVAFVSDRAGSRDIFTMNADGSGVVQTTAEQGAEEAPVWRPSS